MPILVSAIESYINSILTYYKTANRPYGDIPSFFSLQPIWESIATLPSRPDRIAFVGAPGSGKTTLLDNLALSLAQGGNSIPIFLSLRNYSSTLVDLIDVSLSRFMEGMEYEYLIDHIGGDTSIHLLMDGLDEIAPSLAGRFLDDLKNEETRSNISFVLTSRNVLPRHPAFDEWRTFKLPVLSDEQIVDLLKSLDDDRVIGMIFDRPDLKAIARHPLFLYSILAARRTGFDPRAYVTGEISVYTVWRGHTKSLISKEIPHQILHEVMESIAFEGVISESIYLDKKQVLGIIRQYPKYEAELIYQGLHAIDPITVDDEHVRFRHRSYQTSYCARRLLRVLEEKESVFPPVLAVILATTSAAEVIEDLFLEATEDQHRRILASIPLDLMRSLRKMVPTIVANATRGLTGNFGKAESVVSALEGIKDSLSRASRRRRDIVVFTIHGFNTRGNWKNALAPILCRETDGVRFLYHPWDYGEFRAGIFNPFARRRKVQEFQAEYNKVLSDYTASKPEVTAVAHSFGTLILGHALKRFPETDFERVILLGCVLPRNFPWKSLGAKCRRVLNLIGGADFALAVARFVPGLGTGGKHGFLCTEAFLTDHREEFADHSDLFGTEYMKRVWIPFLRDGVVPPTNNYKKPN